MYQIQNITDDSLQEQTLVLDDGSSVFIQMYFMPMQYSWIFTQIIYNNFTLNGLRISNSPNMLQQFRNQIPFGIGCFSTANREPSQQQDFSSGASELYILTAAEVAAYETFLVSGANG